MASIPLSRGASRRQGKALPQSAWAPKAQAFLERVGINQDFLRSLGALQGSGADCVLGARDSASRPPDSEVTQC
jgi:hypothetical protein